MWMIFRAKLPTLPPRIWGEKLTKKTQRNKTLNIKKNNERRSQKKRLFPFQGTIVDGSEIQLSPPGMYQTPVDDGINCLSTGGGCQPSTVSLNHHTGISIDVKFSMWRDQAPMLSSQMINDSELFVNRCRWGWSANNPCHLSKGLIQRVKFEGWQKYDSLDQPLFSPDPLIHSNEKTVKQHQSFHKGPSWSLRPSSLDVIKSLKWKNCY